MMPAMFETAEFKRTLIQFLLANGECVHWNYSTDFAIADLAGFGVDYDKSEMPTVQVTAVADNSYRSAEPTYAKAFAATIVPVGVKDSEHDRHYNFVIPFEDMENLFTYAMLAGISQTPRFGLWEERMNEREYDRIRERSERLGTSGNDPEGR